MHVYAFLNWLVARESHKSQSWSWFTGLMMTFEQSIRVWCIAYDVTFFVLMKLMIVHDHDHRSATTLHFAHSTESIPVVNS